VRPEPVVLPDDALVPAERREPPPAQPTHEVVRAAPFSLTGTARATRAGTLAAGTRVAVVARERGGTSCRVVRDDGLAVYVPCDVLRALRTP
jgi:hypothetical protein